MKNFTFFAAGIALVGGIYLLPAQPGSESAQVTEAKGWNARQPTVKYTVNEFVLSPGQRTRCRQQIQRAMHDPNSFRWEGSMSDMRRTGVIVYSGTNAFGGRVRETYKCA